MRHIEFISILIPWMKGNDFSIFLLVQIVDFDDQPGVCEPSLVNSTPSGRMVFRKINSNANISDIL